MHGYGIAQHLKSVSDEVLQVGESSLYPGAAATAAQRLGQGAWGASEKQPPRQVLHATAAGRKQLAVERREFDRLIVAIHKVLNPA
jgi:DNA-binding PadR family transcriptional regulator